MFYIHSAVVLMCVFNAIGAVRRHEDGFAAFMIAAALANTAMMARVAPIIGS